MRKLREKLLEFRGSREATVLAIREAECRGAPRHVRVKTAPIKPLLKMGKIIHAGKGTSFGLGRFQVVL